MYLNDVRIGGGSGGRQKAPRAGGGIFYLLVRFHVILTLSPRVRFVFVSRSVIVAIVSAEAAVALFAAGRDVIGAAALQARARPVAHHLFLQQRLGHEPIGE